MAILIESRSITASHKYHYTMVKTSWGYIAFVSCGSVLVRLFLEGLLSNKATLEKAVRQQYPTARYADNRLKNLQKALMKYFDNPGDSGSSTLVKFDCKVDLSGASDFSRHVLRSCCKIPTGQTISYSQLASLADRPRAARAIGNIMAKNPVPLIIPCHRVIRSDGSLGGYSGSGGVILKQRLLEHEHVENFHT